MTEEKINLGLSYLAEIKALKDVSDICSAYGWEKLREYDKSIKNLSVLGTDFGKPNASEIMTKLAQGNRLMFYEMKKIVDKRIEDLQNEFNSLK